MLAERLSDLKKLVDDANTDKRSITIVGVTKYTEIERIAETVGGALNDLAENRVQRLVQLKQQPINAKLHLIGHLQSNKVRHAVQCADMIQSVDSEAILREIGREAVRQNKLQGILIQVNIADEEVKFGADADEVRSLAEAAVNTEGISLRGLMTIMPIEINEEYYIRMNGLFNELKAVFPCLETLSMGMTNDFALAIKHGSNMIRIGSYLFK